MLEESRAVGPRCGVHDGEILAIRVRSEPSERAGETDAVLMCALRREEESHAIHERDIGDPTTEHVRCCLRNLPTEPVIRHDVRERIERDAVAALRDVHNCTALLRRERRERDIEGVTEHRIRRFLPLHGTGDCLSLIEDCSPIICCVGIWWGFCAFWALCVWLFGCVMLHSHRE